MSVGNFLLLFRGLRNAALQFYIMGLHYEELGELVKQEFPTFTRSRLSPDLENIFNSLGNLSNFKTL